MKWPHGGWCHVMSMSWWYENVRFHFKSWCTHKAVTVYNSWVQERKWHWLNYCKQSFSSLPPCFSLCPFCSIPFFGDCLLASSFLIFSPFSAGREVGLGLDPPTLPVVLLGSAVISFKACFLSYCFDRPGFHRESSIFCQDSGQRREQRLLRTWA